MKSLIPIFALLLSFVILCLGHGLQSVLVPTRAALDDYSDVMLGVLMSAYYAGFVAGAFSAPKLIARVGHIHVFAAVAAGACATILAFPLLPYSWLWVGLRFLYGFCLVQFYTVMESWLNSISGPQDRGRILSVYMILNFVAMSVGQVLLFSTSAGAGGFAMFSVAAMLIALSLMPLLLSRISRPEQVHSLETFGVKKLYALSPLGVVGAFIVGLAGGAYWGLTPPYILELGFTQAHIAWFMAISLLGGLLAQWPLGALSDRINRRLVIVLAALLVCLSAALLAILARSPDPVAWFGTFWLLVCGALFGAGFHPLYSLCIAHANDFVPSEHFVRASAGLQLMQSTGAIIGPLVAGVLMAAGSNAMLYDFIATLSAVLAAYAFLRLTENRIPEETDPFRLFTRTGISALFMDPRYRTKKRPTVN